MHRLPRVTSLALLSAAAACARYVPAPLDPVAVARDLEARRLDAPGLIGYLAEHGSPAPAAGWSAEDLALAAYYYHPELDLARAEWRAAEAAALTAGARERPNIEGEAGYGVTGTDAVESRWLAALATVFTVEFGGKRGARVAAARARAVVAGVEVEAAGWRIAHGVRVAAGELAAAEGRVADARLAREAADAWAAAVGARYARGEIRGTDVAIAEGGAVEAGAVEAEHVARATVARSALAQAMGIPPAALDAAALRLADAADCSIEAHPDSLRAMALRTRTEVGRALASYTVAEADLRVAVAGSYPDLSFGPGFTWDQGVGRWSLLFGLPRLPLDGNRGPITEASRRREAAAAAVRVAEQQVLAEVATAVARCGAARAETSGADSLAAGAERRAGAARRAFERGEAGAGDTLAALLPAAQARAAAREARRRLASAALALEAALGTWPAGDARRPDPRRAPQRSEDTR